MSSTIQFVDEIEISPVVIDAGSFAVKAGFAGDGNPRSIFQPVVGRPAPNVPKDGLEACYVGHTVESKRKELTLKHPIEQGIVTNWDDMEQIWHHIFHHELAVTPEEHPVLLTEPAFNTNAHRQKMGEIMFETFNTPGLYIAVDAVLSLYANGHTTGVVVNAGDMISHATPVSEGVAVRHAVQRLELAGRILTDYLLRLLNDRGYGLSGAWHAEWVREIKERHGYCALEYERALQEARESSKSERSYEAPDGRVLVVRDERLRCPEALFQPALVGMEAAGLHAMVANAIKQTDGDARHDLFSKIFLTGGTAEFPGLAERLHKELSALAPAETIVNVVKSPYGSNSAWMGGSFMASSASFQGLWISSKEYDESGPNIVNLKCL